MDDLATARLRARLALAAAELAARAADLTPPPRIALAESCTGGMAAAAITDLAGVSTWFVGGVVSYSNDAKIALLKVSAKTLQKHGAVSEEVAREMCLGALAGFNAGFAAAITGVAGPGGGGESFTSPPQSPPFISPPQAGGTEAAPSAPGAVRPFTSPPQSPPFISPPQAGGTEGGPGGGAEREAESNETPQSGCRHDDGDNQTETGVGGQKPVGLVCFAWGAANAPLSSESVHFGGGREAVRLAAASFALSRLAAMV